MKVETDKAGKTTVALSSHEKKSLANAISILRQVSFYEMGTAMAEASELGGSSSAAVLREFTDRGMEPVEAPSGESEEADQ